MYKDQLPSVIFFICSIQGIISTAFPICRKMKLFVLLAIITLTVCKSFAYDLSFNTDRDLNLWKFNGSYIYSRSLQDVSSLLPPSLVRSSAKSRRSGLWLIRYGGPEADNFLSFGYSLHHHLLHQGLVQFIGAPNVPITISSNGGQEVGKFWSDGKTWCDGIFNVNMLTQIKFDIATPNPGNYILIDKVVLGVQGNVTQINNRQINPCRTTPPATNQIDEDDLAPDMAQKTLPNRRSYQQPSLPPTRPPPPDMAVKPAYQGQANQGLPDMRERHRTTQQSPSLDTRTTTIDHENHVAVENDSSDVKCGCSCSCSRQKGKRPANTTMESG